MVSLQARLGERSAADAGSSRAEAKSVGTVRPEKTADRAGSGAEAPASAGGAAAKAAEPAKRKQVAAPAFQTSGCVCGGA
jgi:hypothetical protein